MDAGQMNMMQMPAGGTMSATAPAPSSPTVVPGEGNQAGGLFAGMLNGMTSQGSGRSAAVSSAGGKDAPVMEKTLETVLTVQPEALAAPMAALLNAIGVSTPSPLDGSEASAQHDAVKTGDVSHGMPQEVALNVAGLQSALLVQLNNGRMPSANEIGAGQAAGTSVQGEAAQTGDISGRVLPADSLMAQQLRQDLLVTTESAGVGNVAATASVMAKMDTPAMTGTQTPAAGRSVQQPEPAVAQLKPLPVEAAKFPGLSPTVSRANDTVTAADQKAVTSGTQPAASEQVFRGKDVVASSGIEVQPQPQVVTLPRSTAVEVALAEVTPLRDPSPGHVERTTSAQTVPASDIRSAQQGVLPTATLPSSESSQQAEQTIPIETRTNHALGESRPTPASVALEAGNRAEIRIEGAQVRSERGAVEKPAENTAVDVTKLASTVTLGKELSNGDDKGATDQFINGQLHQSPMHQQGKTENTSTINNVSVVTQDKAPQSDLSSQIASQVRDRLANHEAKPGNEQIVLRLSPENLGDLKLNVSLEGQRLKVEIVAENRMVRDALMQHIDSLKESLARQNISMESFDVTTNGRGAGNPGQGQQNDWRELAQQKQQNAWMSSGGYRLPEVTAIPSQLAYQTPSEHAMVDLHF